MTLATRRSHDSKPDAARGVVFQVAISSRRSFLSAFAIEASSSSDPPLSFKRPFWVNGGRARIRAEIILTPLPDVSQHVVQAECIGCLLSNTVRCARCVVFVPGDVVQRPIGFLATPRSGRIFPFRFRGQADRPTTLDRVDLGQKLLNLLPTDCFHWSIRSRALNAGGIRSHDFLPLVLRHRELAHPVIPGDGHLMRRALRLVSRRASGTKLPIIASSDYRIAPHTKSAGRYFDQFQAGGTQVYEVGARLR